MPGLFRRRAVRRYGVKRTQVGELSHATYGRRLMSKLAADLAAKGVAAWDLDYRGIAGEAGGRQPSTTSARAPRNGDHQNTQDCDDDPR